MADKNDKIEDLEQLEIWLQTQSIQVGQALAARAALRSLPAAMAGVNYDPDDTFAAKLLLFGLRATLVTVNACAQPANVAKDLINALKLATATGTIEFRAEEPVGAANYAILSVVEIDGKFSMQYAMSALLSTANIVGRTFGPAKPPEVDPLVSAVAPDIHPTGAVITHRESMRDVQDLKTGSPFSVFEAPLWQKPQTVERYTLRWDAFAKLPDPNGTWKFWREWYHGFLDGKPLNWELQRRVALIPDDIWDSGPEPVAAAIQEIEAEWAAEHLPQADRIILDEDTGKFDISPLALSPAGIVQTALEQVAFARGVAERSNCGFNTTSVAWEYIEFTLNSCRENANAIEQNFEIARAEIADGLKNGTYFEDPKLAALERVLDTAVTDLRAHHPEVIEAWEKRVQVKLRIAQDDQKQLIVEKATELIAISSPTLGKELELDAKTISNSSGEVQGGAIRRFFGRVAQMRLTVRSSEIVKRIDASTGYKGTRVIQTLHSLVEMIIGLF